jgi:SagB-type dehydrogenase family enzyme
MNSFRHPVRDAIATQIKAHEMAELSPAPPPPSEAASAFPAAWLSEPGKVYSRLPKITLDQHTACISDGLAAILADRRSVRDFVRGRGIPLNVLGRVLATSLTGTQEHRPFASAGGRYPTEVYIVVNTVDGLDPGLYHFDPKRCELAILLRQNLDSLMKEAIGDDAISTPSGYLILTSVLHRSMVKYGARGYRFALIELGAAAQAIQITCQAEALAAVWIGGFADERLREILDLNWELELETPMLILAIGFEENR